MSKLATPDWIKEGYESKEAYEKAHGIKAKKKTGKSYYIKTCPKCNSDEVAVLLTGEEGKGKAEWECKKCKWKGKDIIEKEVSEEEFLKFMEEKGEEVM